MKQIKLITIALFTIIFHLSSIICLFAAGEDITVAGDTQGYTVSLENDTLPPSGSEGEIRYNTTDDKLYVWDGAGWKLLSANKNVATKIVGVRRSPANPALDSLDADRADYICDGTDDQQEINQAIIDIVYSPTTPIDQVNEGVVYLLDGTYNISGATFSYDRPDNGDPDPIPISTPGIVMQSGISLIGAGSGTVLRLASGSYMNIINASNVNRILISQLRIDGSQTGDFNYGIYFTTVTNSKIDKVWVEGMDYYGIILDVSSDNNILSGNNLQGSGSYGIKLVSSDNNVLSGNNVQGSGNSGIILDVSSDNNILSGNNLLGGSDSGIYLNTTSNNNILWGNSLQGSVWGIRIESSKNNTILVNNIQSVNSGIYINGTAMVSSSNNTISNNNIQSTNSRGIDFGFNARDNIISANVISNSRGGIRLGDRINDRNIISFNRIAVAQPTDYEIWIDLANYDNYLVTNYIDGGRGIYDNGARTKYTGKEKITLEQVVDNDSATLASNTSYLQIQFGGTTNNITVDNGKSAGDILIIEGHPGGGTIEFDTTASNIKLCTIATHNPGTDNHPLSTNDTLALTWNGTYWLELSYTNN